MGLYNKQYDNKLPNMKRKLHKDYRRYLNKVCPKENTELPPLDSLYQHFKQASNNSYDLNDIDILNRINLQNNNCELNARISEEEILRCINSLK